MNTLGLTTWLFDTTPIVLPSGAALTIAVRAGDAAGAGQVLDHDRLAAQRLGQRGLRRPHDGVDAGAGADRQDDAQRRVGDWRLRDAAMGASASDGGGEREQQSGGEDG